MSRKPVARSRRQYTQGLNSPAVPIVRDRKEVTSGPMPGFIEPCLAEARLKPPSTDDWVHEIKFDGYRLQIRIDNGQVSCFTRRGHDWRARFPTLTAAAWNLNVQSAIIDGEAVVINEEGHTDFSALESYVSSSGRERSAYNLVFYAFDLLYVNAKGLREDLD